MAVSIYHLFAWLVLLKVCRLSLEAATKPPHIQCTVINQTRAKCAHLNLTSVPQNLPNTLEVLDLSYNNLTVLCNESFTRYNCIQILNIGHNFIHDLESGTFGNLLGLEKLILDHNAITEIPSTPFMNDAFISTLILSSNKFRKIPYLYGLCSSKRLQRNTPVSEMTNVTLIDFSSNSLTIIEEKDFAPFIDCSISKFKLTYNKLTSLPEKVFSGFSKVDMLDISQNNLSHFEVRSFLGIHTIREISLVGSHINYIIPLNKSHLTHQDQFPEIDVLSLQSNNITLIPDYALIGFRNLHELHLESNKIKSISNRSFCGLSSLIVLNLSHNKLKHLPFGAFACLTNLEFIDMSLNFIHTLDPGWFAGTSSLKHLDLYRSNINEIKDGSWNTTNLQILNFKRNKLNSISRPMFIGLSRLTILRFSGNSLYKIGDDTFSDMTSLEVLQIDNVEKILIDGSFAECRNIVFLDLSFCEWVRFTTNNQFTHMSALTTLNMSYSNISASDLFNEMTSESLFLGLTSLRTLILSGNHDLKHLQNVSWIFSPLQNLKKLYLTTCGFVALQSELFKSLSRLQELHLERNWIVSITERVFQNLRNLQVLHLEDNKMTSIEKRLFKGTVNLKQLYLQGNKISTIAPATIIPSNLYLLNVSDNPFICNCKLAWFREWLKSTRVELASENNVRCSGASFKPLINQPLTSFHPEEYCGINIFLVTGITVASVAVLFICVLVYYKRWWFNHKIFLLKLAVLGYDEITEDVDPNDYEYQLNLMFHEDDKDWVNDCVKPALEERMPHLAKVAFGDDDLDIGMYYLNALYHNIENSFKTALLLSNQSVYDPWFMTKIRMSVEHVNDTKLDKIILIFLEDIQEANLPYLVRLLLSRNKPYMLWTDDEDGQDLFWAQFEKDMRANKAINSVIPT